MFTHAKLRAKPKRSEDATAICCIGAINVDKILTFTEAPAMGRDTTATSKLSLGGVACNLAQVLKQFNREVACVGVVGQDVTADFVLQELAKYKISSDKILRLADAATATYTAFHRPDGELHIAAIELAIYNNLRPDHIIPLIAKLSSYQHWWFDSCYPAEVYRCFAKAARSSKANIYITISSVNGITNIIPLLPVAKILFCNLDELCHLSQNFNTSPKGIRRSLEIIASHGVATIFATNGAVGVHAFTAGKHFFQAAVPVKNVVSVNGAGDTFAAATLDSLLQGAAIEHAMYVGVRAAARRIAGESLVAMQPGVIAEDATKVTRQGKRARLIR